MELYQGIVEDVNDPLKSGRVRVRIFGMHTDDKNLIPTASLPWAQILKTTDSASVSGVGNSALGLVSGSWVIVYFLDSDNQYPIVLGSLHGIPDDPLSTSATNEYLTTTGAVPNTVVDSSGTPVTTSDGTPVTTGEDTGPILKRASSFPSVSQKCIDLIKAFEGYRSTAYQDSIGKWTIGYGSTYYPDGTPVKEGDTVNRNSAEDYLLFKIVNDFLPKVQKMVTVPVTQEMVDALVSLVYNIGSIPKGALIITDLNSGKYELAAARFLDYNKARINGTLTVLRGLSNRREKEKDLFLSGGIPAPIGGVDPAPKEPFATSNTPENNPDTQPPTVNEILGEKGFSDPKAKYPLYRNEPDTHRLARHEKIIDTIVYRKEIGRIKKVPIAGTDKTWDQSPVPYNAQYPFNRVYSSESGHLLEFDDTEDCRRVHLYHSAGTFTEIDENGTKVNKIVGDSYTILERNGYVYIRGAQNVTVEGAHNLKVEGTANIDIDGATQINVFNHVKMNISGDLYTAVAGDMRTSVSGNYHVKVDGNFAVDANRIDLNSNIAQKLPEPKPMRTVEEIELAELTVVTRTTEGAMQYETPEEGDATKYNEERIKRGDVAKEDLEEVKPTEPPEKVTETAPDRPLVGDCAEIHTMTSFPSNYKLSTHFTIGSFNKNGARPLVTQAGLTPDKIACNLKFLAMNALDVVKDLYPNMIITSGYRRPGDAPNSSATSRHYTGEAVDIQLPGFSRKQYVEAIKNIAAMIKYDQLILEYQGTSTTWIHIGYSRNSSRSQLFTMNNHKRISGFGEVVLV